MVPCVLQPLALRVALALTPLLLLALPASAQTEVDLALVLAVDISYSMDPEEQALQREGFAEAFRSPLVHDAIRRGMLGRIAVTYMEWAGASDQKVIVPWTILDNPESLMAFADKIANDAAATGAAHLHRGRHRFQRRSSSRRAGSRPYAR